MYKFALLLSLAVIAASGKILARNDPVPDCATIDTWLDGWLHSAYLDTFEECAAFCVEKGVECVAFIYIVNVKDCLTKDDDNFVDVPDYSEPLETIGGLRGCGVPNYSTPAPTTPAPTTVCCDSIEVTIPVTMSDEMGKKYISGTYQQTDNPVNDNPVWRKSFDWDSDSIPMAIWYSPGGNWVVGEVGAIGTSSSNGWIRSIDGNHDCPQEAQGWNIQVDGPRTGVWYAVHTVYGSDIVMACQASQCIDNSQCTEPNKGTCNTGTNTCECDSGFVADGSSCVECIDNSQCTEPNKGTCNTGTNTCECDSGADGSSCVECIDNSQCTEANKGTCNTGTNTCECDSGFVADGSSCVGISTADGCPWDGNTQEITETETAAVRCCNMAGNRCFTPNSPCLNEATFDEAQEACNVRGLRICTPEELGDNLCCNTGCKFDNKLIWQQINQDSDVKSELEIIDEKIVELQEDIETIWSWSPCPAILSSDFHSTRKIIQEQCYTFSSVEKTWTEAQTICINNGGKLVEPKTEAQFDAVVINANEIIGSNKFFWIALSDAGTEKGWFYPDGSTISYRNWLPWTPSSSKNPKSNGNTDCVHPVYLSTSTGFSYGKWQDSLCGSSTSFFICEFN